MDQVTLQTPKHLMVFLKIELKFLHFFAVLADKNVCGRDNSSSQGGGQGLVDIRGRPVSLISFLFQHCKNCYLLSLKLNIYQILYMFVYLVLLKCTLILSPQE